MPKRRYPYVLKEKSRHGRVTWYFRRGKGQRVRLPDEYGSPEFMAAYHAALAGEDAPRRPRTRAKTGTLAWLFEVYKQSGAFARLAPSTRQSRDAIMRKVADRAGNAAIAAVTPAVIRRSREERAHTPAAANDFIKAMRGVFSWAVEAGYADADPTAGIKKMTIRTTGYHTWTVEEIEQYQGKFPVGTKARLALDILVYTGLRRSDVVRLGLQHLRDGKISIATQKTGTQVDIPALPPLLESIEATETGDMVFLVTEYGRAFSAAGFGNWFRERCREAGVPGSAHGLRKAAATLAAEQGATEHELMAIFGWMSSAQAVVYTRAANRKTIGLKAGKKLLREQTPDIFPAPPRKGAGSIAE